MKTYTVVFKIEVDADSEMDAALQVEEFLNDLQFRPCLEVSTGDSEPVIIDLELEYYVDNE